MVFLELRRDSRVTTGNSGCLLCWPRHGQGFGWTPGVGDGQGGMVSCGLWGSKESDMTE